MDRLGAAAAARSADLGVTVLEMGELPLLRVLGPEVAQLFADLHTRHGVDMRFGVQITQIVGEDGSVTGVVLADGTTIPAGTVVVGVGITPNVGLAEAAGLDVGDGIIVDQHLRSSDPDIFAAGDVACAFHPGWSRRARRTLGQRTGTSPRSPPGRSSGRMSHSTGRRTSSPISTTWEWNTPDTLSQATTTQWFSAGTRQWGVHRVLDQGRARARRHEREHLGRHRRHQGAGAVRPAGGPRGLGRSQPGPVGACR